MTAADSSAYQVGGLLAIAILAVLLVALVRRLRRGGRTGRERTTDAIAAVVVAVLLVGAGVRAVDAHTEGPWDTTQGRTLRAGFIAGCQDSSSGTVDCTCTFTYIASRAPYDTPAGFASLEPATRRAIEARDPSALPSVVLEALRSCRAG